MSTPRELHCYEYATMPYEEVRAILRRDAHILFQRATLSALERAKLLGAALRAHVGPIEGGAEMKIRIVRVTEEISELGERSMRLEIAWTAAKNAALFPSMDATLIAHPLSSGETQIALHGRYRTPLGPVGPRSTRSSAIASPRRASSASCATSPGVSATSTPAAPRVNHARRGQPMRTTTLAIVLSLVMPACASPEPKPDDMSAAAHRVEADRERDEARAALARASTSEREQGVVAPGTYPGRGPWTEPYPEVQKREGSPALEAAIAHSRHAQAHEKAAAELERFEEAECRDIPAETRAACPLLHDVVDIVDVYGGARVMFAPGVSVPEVVTHIRCHLAFARARAFADADDCPLYVRGVQVAPSGAHALTLTAQDETERELTRRIRSSRARKLSPQPSVSSWRSLCR